MMASTWSGQRTSIIEKTGAYTATTADYVLLVDSTGGDVTITLPTGVDGQEFVVKKTHDANTVYVDATESFDRGGRLTLDQAQHSVRVAYHSTTTKWHVIDETTWSTIPLEFPVMMATHSITLIEADGYCALGNGTLDAGVQSTDYTLAPIDGTIHSLRAEISGTALTAGQSWVFTLYKNGASTGLSCTIGEAETTATDLTDRISVTAGDTLAIYIEETGTGQSNAAAISVIYEATAQPMFSRGSAAGSTKYGAVQTAHFDGSGGQDRCTLFPCAGTLQKFYGKAAINASGEQVTATLQEWDESTGWANVSPSVTLQIDYDADGDTNSDLATTHSVSAGDLLRWKYEDTGTGTPGYMTVCCQFVPTTAGDKIITGQVHTYNQGDADGYAGPMGSFDDFAADTSVPSQSLVPVSGTAQDLYVACAADPGATAKWIQVELTKNGTGTGIAAKITDPSQTASDTSNTAAFTGATDDMGINITNSGDTPASQDWVAWGFVYR